MASGDVADSAADFVADLLPGVDVSRIFCEGRLEVDLELGDRERGLLKSLGVATE